MQFGLYYLKIQQHSINSSSSSWKLNLDSWFPFSAIYLNILMLLDWTRCWRSLRRCCTNAGSSSPVEGFTGCRLASKRPTPSSIRCSGNTFSSPSCPSSWWGICKHPCLFWSGSRRPVMQHVRLDELGGSRHLGRGRQQNNIPVQGLVPLARGSSDEFQTPPEVVRQGLVWRHRPQAVFAGDRTSDRRLSGCA